ncbi:YnbE family lipoprotein [Hephaestia mangrovi]|uniref:YnbE family lipoprotein n=1 Tax=Hephaestia mangrovi TaxID=2873268 RepID=UPI0021042F1D|nr:YnbE family lipoprotein [Hephaestia mangrovi]
MKNPVLTNGAGVTTKVAMRSMVIAAMMGTSGLLGGCVTVNAPTKPIQIDLNINVTQQVVYRLDSEAKSVIQQNPGIF